MGIVAQASVGGLNAANLTRMYLGADLSGERDGTIQDAQ